MNIRNRLAGATVVLLAGACAPATQQGPEAPQSRSATVSVDNQNWMDVAIYVVRGPVRTRLGSVNSMSKEQFTIPASYANGMSDITVLADPVGSTESYRSPPIQVYAGSIVRLTLANRLALSHFAVFATN